MRSGPLVWPGASVTHRSAWPCPAQVPEPSPDSRALSSASSPPRHLGTRNPPPAQATVSVSGSRHSLPALAPTPMMGSSPLPVLEHPVGGSGAGPGTQPCPIVPKCGNWVTLRSPAFWMLHPGSRAPSIPVSPGQGGSLAGGTNPNVRRGRAWGGPPQKQENAWHPRWSGCGGRTEAHGRAAGCARGWGRGSRGQQAPPPNHRLHQGARPMPLSVLR